MTVRDSWFSFSVAFFLATSLLAGPTEAVTKKKPVKLAAPVAAPVEPQPNATDLIAKSHDAQSHGDTELALRLAQSAIVADPAHAFSYDALGDIYAANHQPDFARSYYNEALSIDPTDGAAQKAVAALDREGDQRSANAEGMKTGTP